MNRLPFSKYTSCGNNFVIVDETAGKLAPEQTLSRIANTAIDGCFGVGADNFVVVQRCDSSTLDAISEHRGYWFRSPTPGVADYLFRMFEPDGVEALACGNGLLCVAQYLHDHAGCERASIMTRVPLEEPAVIGLGVGDSGRAWVDLGRAVRMPESLADRSTLDVLSDDIDRLENVEVTFRKYDLAPFFKNTSLSFSGYVTFTGEPHLVIFPEGTLAEILFGPSANPDATGEQEKRQRFGTWLLGHVGDFMNKRTGSLFPQGISVNVARVVDSQTLEYRTYERGIWRETLACGTGGVAVAHVARTLGMVQGEAISLIPHRCTWHGQDSRLHARCGAQGDWLLEGNPASICDGEFRTGITAGEPADPGHSATRDSNGRVGVDAKACEPGTGVSPPVV